MSKEAILLFFLFILGSCSEPKIIGYWKIETKMYSESTDSTLIKNKEFGDLILSSDSTYLMKGFGSNNSTTPGWHVGGDERGSWKGSTKAVLVLYPDYYKSFIPESWQTFGRTKFKIVELGKKQLVLSSLDTTRRLSIGSLTKYRRS